VITSATVAEWLTEATEAHFRADIPKARELTAKARRQGNALARDTLLAIERNDFAAHDWSHCAAASELASELELTPEERAIFKDWGFAADAMANPGKLALAKLRERCLGRTILESYPLAPILERHYARALDPEPSLLRLIELYPLPPSPAQRPRVRDACLAGAKKLSDGRRPDGAAEGLALLGQVLDLLHCAVNADPSIETLPDSLRILNLTAASFSLLLGQLPTDWEKPFLESPDHPGYVEHPLHYFMIARVAASKSLLPQSLEAAERTYEAIGKQRTNTARSLAFFFATDVYQNYGTDTSIMRVRKKFAEIASSKSAWSNLANTYAAAGDEAGAAEARARADTAEHDD
jgi:hypothetical protein